MIGYKIDILNALKKKGYNTYVLRKEKLLSEGTLTKIRRSEYIDLKTIDTICMLLDCQPGDLLQYIPASKTDTV